MANRSETRLLAYLLACDDRTIRDYARRGLVVRNVRGYKIQASVRNVVAYLREQAAGRLGIDGETNVVRSSAALKDAQRQLTEIRIAEARGELIPIAEIEALWSQLVHATRRLILSFPERARFALSKLDGHDQQILAELAADMLREVTLQGSPILPAEANEKMADE